MCVAVLGEKHQHKIEIFHLWLIWWTEKFSITGQNLRGETGEADSFRELRGKNVFTFVLYKRIFWGKKNRWQIIFEVQKIILKAVHNPETVFEVKIHLASR